MWTKTESVLSSKYIILREAVHPEDYAATMSDVRGPEEIFS